MIHRFVSLSVFLFFVVGCSHSGSGNAAHPDATVGAIDASHVTIGLTPPENLLIVLRGATLRRAVPLLVPQAGAAEVLAQLSHQVTPGIANHGDEIDVDSPFAVAGTITGTGQSTLTFFVAWPLRPGMQVAQDARSGRGFRQVAPGMYAPSTPDAGADAENQCWVAQRRPVGWMLLCGPREGLSDMAGFLHQQAETAPDNAAIIDLDVRTGMLRRLFTSQLAELDRNAPPRASTGPEATQRAMFEEARRTVNLLTSMANDLSVLHGSITQDENAMHLRAELTLDHASSDQTRGLITASAARQAPDALVQLLPATVTAWMVGGFDRAPILGAMGAPQIDPQVAAQAGPELAHAMGSVEEMKSLLPLGERIDGYSNEDGYTMYRIVRRADAVQFVSDLRVAINSIPSRPVPGGGTLRDLAVTMPTPGLTGTNILRVGRNVHIPPGTQVPPEVRAAIDRSMLLVAEGDHLVAITGRDPVARYRAMSTGARLTATIPANAVYAGRITPPSFPGLFFGSPIPGLPESHTTDGLDFALTVERRGEGAHAELHADAPIGAGMEIRSIYGMIQELQARMMQQMMEQQRAAQNGGGAGPRGPAPTPEPAPDNTPLPEPPHFQLQAPQ